jgi:NAD(P)-dependent dehydrogenase (short-subunit alcohol dehydrogenase family)
MIGILLVTQALLPLIKKRSKKVVLNIGSLAGSSVTQNFIQDYFVSVHGIGNTFFGYRLSKAAVHTCMFFSLPLFSPPLSSILSLLTLPQ